MRTITCFIKSTVIATAILLAGLTTSAVAATFTVTNTLNTGAGSLRQAVTDSNSAAGSDTIVFDAAVFSTPQTIALASVITLNPATGDTLSITGPGVNLLTIDGNDGVGSNVRIFTVSSGDTVSISGMTLTNGGDGAIDNSGMLTLSGMAFVNNTNGNGGAIATGGASLSITNCTFSGNTATSGSATGLGGGAIYQSLAGSTTTISNSTFTNNAEVGGSGGGGAIRNRTGSMDISNSTFTGNTTVEGGGAIVNSETMTISGSTFTGNSATNTGGAIYTSGTSLTISSTLINSNTAGTDGGGLYVNTSGNAANILNSTISNNIANSDNGATGTGRGGGIFNQGELTIVGSTIRGNQALGTASSRGVGGAIGTNAGTINLTNSTVSGNSAQQVGGGIHLLGTAGSITSIDSSTIVENTTTGAGGGIVRASTTNPVNLKNSIFANNSDNGTAPNVQGAVVSQGYNLIEVTTGATISGDTATNITGQDPILGPLQDNGGLTFTHALLAGSPAIDKGVSGTLTEDQRLQTRPVDNPAITNAVGGNGADIGAFEVQPTMQFSSATYNIGEGGGSATITVNRTNGSEGVDSIQYATSNGTATGGASCGGGVDYQNASGTLTFNGGVTSQSFSVTICEDSQIKGSETINLTLSIPVGATLGTPSTAVLTIGDNDTPTPTPTNTPTATPTSTPTATPTTTPTNTPTATPTATPTSTPTATPTATPTGTPTGTPTATPTSTPTATPTATPTGTPTATPTATPTGTPTATPTATPTSTPTSTPTATPTATPTGTATPTPSPTPGFESDVAPRPNGDGIVIATDVTQLRRFATGLDTPGVGTNEGQRADCAPRATSGDGIINSGDVIQGRRYATGLDPLTGAGGPTVTAPPAEGLMAIIEDVYAYFFGREIRVGSMKAESGSTVTVPVEITPYGDEAAASFTIEYDSKMLSNPRVSLGEAAPENAVLTVNTNEDGRIGILVDSTERVTASAMPKQFVTITFDVAPYAGGETPIRLTSSLAAKGASDSDGNMLTVRYLNGVISFAKPDTGS